MWSLEQIKKNNQPRPVAESETTRHCSYSGDVASGIVLHSAKQRSTVFIQAGAEARRFVSRYAMSSNRDALVESYF